VRNLLTILLLALLSGWINGQSGLSTIDSLVAHNIRPKIGLALSGGAAHGLAHIGVIQYLDEIGLEIDYITGTSMGAIIGALYAMGYDGKKIEEIAKDMDWDAILNNKIPLDEVAAVEKSYHDKYPLTFVIDDNHILLPQGFLNTNKLELELVRLFAPATFMEDFGALPRSFRCFGVDIEKGEIVTLRKGRLTKALRASMAIPSVFAPKYYDGRHLVDGGLMRNFPVSDNKEMGSDFVIGSYVGREKADISDLRTLVDILTESAFMMSIVDSEHQKQLTDVLLTPDVKESGVFDFDLYESFIEKGYQAAKSNSEELLRMAKVMQQFPKKAMTPLEEPGFLFIDSIAINEMPLADQKLVLDKLSIKERSYLTFRAIEHGVNRVASTLNFESVSYDIRKKDSHTVLYIEAVPREEKRLGINLNHFAHTNSSLIMNGQIRNFLLRLSNLRVSLRISENAAFGGEYFVRGGFTSKNWVFGARIEAQRYDLIYFSQGRQRQNGFMWEGHIRPYVTYEFSNFASLRAELDVKRHDFRNELRRDLDIKKFVESGTKVALSFTYDNRDARAMTTDGLLFHTYAGYGFEVDNDIQYTVEEAANALDIPFGDKFFEGEVFMTNTIPLNDRLWWSLSGSAYYKSSPSLLDNYRIGGTTIEGIRNLPFMGFREQELRTDQHLYLRSDLRIGVFDNVSVALVGNVLFGESNSFDYIAPERDNTFTAYGLGLEFGIMLPIGPVLFDIGYSSEADNVNTEISIGWKHFY